VPARAKLLAKPGPIDDAVTGSVRTAASIRRIRSSKLATVAPAFSKPALSEAASASRITLTRSVAIDQAGKSKAGKSAGDAGPERIARRVVRPAHGGTLGDLCGVVVGPGSAEWQTPPDDLLVVYDLDKQGWRSFYAKSLVSFSFTKETV
jgi:hypothetical protein